MAYPRFMRARAFKFLTRTSGNFTPASTSWADLTTSMDITLNAQVGDVLEYGVSGTWNSEAVQGCLDVATIVSSSPVNHWFSGGTNTNDGVDAWSGQPSAVKYIGGSVMYQVAAADIASGLVTLRLRVRCSTASTKTLIAGTVDPLHVWAKNLGPPDPN